MQAQFPQTVTEARAKSTVRSACNAVWEVAAETLWPTRCAGCDVPGTLLCDECRNALRYIDTCRACKKCGAPFGLAQCTECNPVMLGVAGRDALPFENMASALMLDARSRRIAALYKDGNERRLASVMAEIMARYISPEWVRSTPQPVISFIPASAAARRRRGFDHAEHLAQELARSTEIACVPLLMRPRAIDQRKLSRRQRIANMGKSMEALPGASIPEHIILIDDVCTTGATLYAAADALRSAGASELHALTFARVYE